MSPERDPWDGRAGLNDAQAAQVVAAARGVYSRFLDEAIERHSYCPYARQSRAEQTSVVEVVLERLDPDAQLVPGSALAAVVDRWIGVAAMEVVQVVFPRVQVDAARWERWAKALTSRIRSLRPGPAVWAVAAFHPELSFGTGSAAELVPLFRRSPDPTVQWIRLDALDRLRTGRPEGDVVLPTDPRSVAALLAAAQRAPLHERVAENNERTVERLGLEAAVSQLADLAAEARRAYAAIERGG